ncbi:hypothetical protein ABZ891_19520 [Streptomyces sp. NPDC047023]|uniref:hypothetical protein n=1 Tax=Streptomyces sp. NPDC047023 TaxID=3155139 RepID=UPI0033E3802D
MPEAGRFHRLHERDEKREDHYRATSALGAAGTGERGRGVAHQTLRLRTAHRT